MSHTANNRRTRSDDNRDESTQEEKAARFTYPENQDKKEIAIVLFNGDCSKNIPSRGTAHECRKQLCPRQDHFGMCKPSGHRQELPRQPPRQRDARCLTTTSGLLPASPTL